MLIFDLLKRALTGTLIDPCRYFFPWGGGASDVDFGDNIPYSLMLDGPSSQCLSRTFGTPTNQTVFTFSFWLQRGLIGANQVMLSNAGTTEYLGFHPTTLDAFALALSGTFRIITSLVLARDPGAWMHIVWQSTGTATNLYCNNNLIGTYAGVGSSINSAILTYLGFNTAISVDGCIALPIFVDGQSLTPSSFGRISADTGQWVNKKYTGTYGANGFKLEFLNGAALGTDTSGNGNNWTLNGGITSANQFTGTPTNNYCTLNPLDVTSTVTLSKGNLTASVATVNGVSKATLGVTSGKWYWEVKILSSLNYAVVGVAADTCSTWPAGGGFFYAGSSAGAFKVDYSGTQTAYGATYTLNDVIGVALDMDNGTLEFFKNGVSQGVTFSTGIAGKLLFPVASQSNGSAMSSSFNFGQLPFTYTAPTGFKALCAANLPTPAILKGSSHYTTKLDTGANIKATCEATYPYLLEWIKDRANANNHQLLSTVSGLAGNALQSNTTSPGAAYSAPAGSSVGWCWNLAQAAANNAGSIASSVSANITAGIAVGAYIGTGVNATVGHGLGFAPAASDGYMLMVKDTTVGSANNWMVMHSGFTSAAYYAVLNSTAAEVLDATAWQSTAPTSSVFSIGTNAAVNTNGHTYEFILFFGVKGFSKFGTWTATGVAATAPFVYMGFKPALIGGKFKSQPYNWMQKDSARNPNNPVNLYLYPCTTGADASDVYSVDDFVSNGLKMRSNSYFNGYNASSVFAYYAFAEVPQKFATAR